MTLSVLLTKPSFQYPLPPSVSAETLPRMIIFFDIENSFMIKREVFKPERYDKNVL